MLNKRLNTHYLFIENLLPHLPLLSMVLFAALTHFLMGKTQDAEQYLIISLQTLLECLPFFIAHQLAINCSSILKPPIWALGFILYPMVLTNIANVQLSSEDVVICAFASAIWFVSKRLKEHSKGTQLKQLTLDRTVKVLLIIWALIMAAILTSNQSINEQTPSVLVHSQELVNQSPKYLANLWQCLIIALIINCMYLINRYWLIQQILAKHGVLAFLSTAIIFLLLATPLLSALILYLPVNQNDNLALSFNQSPFALANFQFNFLLLAISTPLILLFERQKQEATLAKAEQQQTTTELQLLQQQINPHFLFNTLNNLYAMTLTKSDDAPDLIVKLSNLLRYTIYEGKKPQVTLAQEIAYLQDYIALEHIRVHNKCIVNQQWPQGAQNFTLPPLLLIMIIENAFKHGVAASQDDSFINFTIKLEDRTLTLICENSLPAEQTSKDKGIGLENLQRRLSLLYPNSHQLTFGPQDKLWRAELTLELTPC